MCGNQPIAHNNSHWNLQKHARSSEYLPPPLWFVCLLAPLPFFLPSVCSSLLIIRISTPGSHHYHSTTALRWFTCSAWLLVCLFICQFLPQLLSLSPGFPHHLSHLSPHITEILAATSPGFASTSGQKPASHHLAIFNCLAVFALGVGLDFW